MNDSQAPMSDGQSQLQLFDLTGRHVLVVGLGESGLAMARWVKRCGGHVQVADTRSDTARAERLQQVAAGTALHTGPLVAGLLEGIDLVAWSPGLSIELGEPAQFFQLVRERGIRVVGEIELFAQALAQMAQSGYRPKLVAITGTNGKTTTTSLLTLLCQSAGVSARAAGNISPAALDALADAIDANDLPQVWVLELSSFQLSLTDTLSADAAVILNVTQDHLDWHQSMASYTAAKRRIHSGAKQIIVNRDDPATAPPLATDAGVKGAVAKAMVVKATVAKATVVKATDDRVAPGTSAASRTAVAPRSFGLSAPSAVDQVGIVHEGALDWFAQAVLDESAPRRRGKDAAPYTVVRLMPVEALRIRGQHNQANALAALALLRAIDLPLAKSLHGLRQYDGEPHRCEWVLSINGVDYIDDSKGTNVGATAAALIGMGKRCVLIVGGDGKGQDFGPLLAPVRTNARAVVLIGRDAPLIEAALRDSAVPMLRADSMERAVTIAAEQARAGDVVLMSPACASFDMFRNYPHRAQVFVAAVHALASEQGVVV